MQQLQLLGTHTCPWRSIQSPCRRIGQPSSPARCYCRPPSPSHHARCCRQRLRWPLHRPPSPRAPGGLQRWRQQCWQTQIPARQQTRQGGGWWSAKHAERRRLHSSFLSGRGHLLHAMPLPPGRPWLQGSEVLHTATAHLRHASARQGCIAPLQPRSSPPAAGDLKRAGPPLSRAPTCIHRCLRATCHVAGAVNHMHVRRALAGGTSLAARGWGGGGRHLPGRVGGGGGGGGGSPMGSTPTFSCPQSARKAWVCRKPWASQIRPSMRGKWLQQQQQQQGWTREGGVQLPCCPLPARNEVPHHPLPLSAPLSQGRPCPALPAPSPLPAATPLPPTSRPPAPGGAPS